MTLTEIQARVLREIDAMPDAWADGEPIVSICPERRDVAPLADQWAAASKRVIPPPPSTIAEAAAVLMPRVFDSHGASEVIRMVADEMGVSSADICGDARDKRISAARALAAWMLRTKLKLDYPAVGRLLGGKTYSTVMYACRRVEREMGNV